MRALALSKAIEIERKFLLDEPPQQLEGQAGKRIEQGYVTAGESIELRLTGSRETSSPDSGGDPPATAP